MILIYLMIQVHYIAISTEIPYKFPELVQKQWEWVQADLIAANKNREKVPWIVIHGHRGMYCSCDNSCISENAVCLVHL